MAELQNQIAFKAVHTLFSLSTLAYDFKKIQHWQNEKESSKLETPDDLKIFKLGSLCRELLFNLSKDFQEGRMPLFIHQQKTTDFVGCIASSEHAISVVFRGTDSVRGWLNNLLAVKVKATHGDPAVKYHKGFQKNLFSSCEGGTCLASSPFNALVASIEQELMRRSKSGSSAGAAEDVPIYVTGHSLGGALATLFAYHLSLLPVFENKKITVVSFCSPRVGNLQFRQEFDKRTNLRHFRITHGADPCSTVPIYKYHHVGTAIALHTSGKHEKYFNYDYSVFHFSLPFNLCVTHHRLGSLYRTLQKIKQRPEDWDSWPENTQSTAEMASSVVEDVQMDALVKVESNSRVLANDDNSAWSPSIALAPAPALTPAVVSMPPAGETATAQENNAAAPKDDDVTIGKSVSNDSCMLLANKSTRTDATDLSMSQGASSSRSAEDLMLRDTNAVVLEIA